MLAVLLLRGAQTCSELRVNCERLHRFADLSAVEGFLEELTVRAAKTRAARSSSSWRARPDSREQRWMHLLCGAVDPGVHSGASDTADFVATSEIVALKAQHAALQLEVNELRGLVDRLYSELGVARN